MPVLVQTELSFYQARMSHLFNVTNSAIESHHIHPQYCRNGPLLRPTSHPNNNWALPWAFVYGPLTHPLKEGRNEGRKMSVCFFPLTLIPSISAAAALFPLPLERAASEKFQEEAAR